MIDDSFGINVILLAAVALIMLFVGLQIFGAATSPEMHAYVDASEQWCHDRDGELVNVQSIVHGGLHCQFQNGTMIHMSEVDIELDGEIHGSD